MSPIYVGVTPCTRSKEDGVEQYIPETYIHALEKAGLTPILLAYELTENDLNRILPTLSGVLFTGGPDVEPARYGHERLDVCGPNQPVRDEAELLVFKKAYAAELPILGICRGIQLINVALGGTLIQDLPSHCGETHVQSNKELPPCHHGVIIEPDSLLSALCPELRATVNSYHHQAVDRLGRDLRLIAVNETGRVNEAVESTGDSFLLAVQWHPERTTDEDDLSAAIFSRFAEACRG